MNNHHFLLISLFAQGHINPTLQLAKNLTRAGARVTFATTVYGIRQLKTLPSIDGLTYTSFSDGHDEDQSGTRRAGYMEELKSKGSQNLTNLLLTLSKEGRQVTFLVYTLLLPWAAEVAREMRVPSAFLSIHSATTLSIYQRFFNSHDGVHNSINTIDPLISMKLPGLPLFAHNEFPTFLLPTNPFYSAMVPVFQEHIRTLEKDPNPCVLINTFNALEENTIKGILNINVIPIGPLVPSSFSDDGNNQTDSSYGYDLFQSSSDKYLQWLDSKPPGSVIYVSFGSLVVLQKRQKEELFQGLIEFGQPFLWVLRDHEDEEVKDFREKIGNGLIVPWCSQVDVLCHRAIGCFVTHCGWNSTVESLVAGVAVVGCPHFADQTTNAKMVEEVWGTGVRAMADDEGVVGKEEIKRCTDIVMGGGDKGEEIRRNVMKWKGLAIEAVKEGGSSSCNLKQFLERLA